MAATGWGLHQGQEHTEGGKGGTAGGRGQERTQSWARRARAPPHTHTQKYRETYSEMGTNPQRQRGRQRRLRLRDRDEGQRQRQGWRQRKRGLESQGAAETGDIQRDRDGRETFRQKHSKDTTTKTCSEIAWDGDRGRNGTSKKRAGQDKSMLEGWGVEEGTRHQCT